MVVVVGWLGAVRPTLTETPHPLTPAVRRQVASSVTVRTPEHRIMGELVARIEW
jgi:hypothetical protein